MAAQKVDIPCIRQDSANIGRNVPTLAPPVLRCRRFLLCVRSFLLPLLCAAFFLSGCAESYPRLEKIAPLPDSTRCRAAVLSFSYQGDFPRGEYIVSKAFVAEMAAIPGFDVVSEGDIQQMYKQFRLYPKDQPNQDQMRVLAQRLGADTLVVGDILRMSEVEAGNEVRTELAMVLNVYAGASGNLLWSTYHRRTGNEYRRVLHYGRVNSMSGLARRMAQEIITLWIENGMKQCTH